jgi:glycosyl transferase, family 25
VPFIRHATIDATSLSAAEVEDFARRRPASQGAWPAAHVASFLSPSDIWQLIAMGSDWEAAVFEDDVHLAGDIATFLNSNDWMPADADVVRLEGMGL